VKLPKLDEAEYETRIIRTVTGIKVINPPADRQTEPPILVAVGYTETGALDVRMTPTDAQEMLKHLSTHPLVRGAS
jgi:hypothetical protein